MSVSMKSENCYKIFELKAGKIITAAAKKACRDMEKKIERFMYLKKTILQ